MTPSSPARLGSLKGSWNVLSQTAVWITSVVATFLYPPPVWISSGDNGMWRRLGNFNVAVLVGLAFIAARKWNKRRHLKWWVVASALFLAAAIASYFWYQHLLLYRTCDYRSGRVVIGAAYTPQGNRDHRDNPGLSCEDLLDDFVGKADDVWTEASINRNRMLLAGSYVLTVPLFAMCIIGILEAIRLSQPRERVKRNPS